MNPKSWEVQAAWPVAANRPHGVGWEGDSLWVSQFQPARLFPARHQDRQDGGEDSAYRDKSHHSRRYGSRGPHVVLRRRRLDRAIETVIGLSHKLYDIDIAETIMAALDMPRRALWPALAIFANNPWKDD